MAATQTKTAPQTANAALFFYDIPKRRGIANPSGILRRTCVRLQWSCWVILEGREPWSVIHDLESKGARVDVVPLPGGPSENLLKMMSYTLQKDAEEAIDRAIESERDAKKLDDVNEAIKRVRLNTKRMNRVLDELNNSAAMFGLSIDMGKVLAKVSTLGDSYKLKAALYRKLGSQVAAYDPALSQAAAVDAVPAYALADCLEENGGDASAARAAFDLTPAAMGCEANGNGRHHTPRQTATQTAPVAPETREEAIPETTARVTFYRLRDGDWGVRGPVGSVIPGNRVRVYRANGTYDVRRIGTVLWTGDGVRIARLG